MKQTVWESRLAPILPVLYEINKATWEEFVSDYAGKAYKLLSIAPPILYHSLLIANTRRRFDESVLVMCIGKGLDWRFIFSNKAENWLAIMKWKKVDGNLLISTPTTKTLFRYVTQVTQMQFEFCPETINLVLGHQSDWIEQPPLFVVCPNGRQSNAWTFAINGNESASSINVPSVDIPPSPAPNIIPITIGEKK